jgi:hypothetical protein
MSATASRTAGRNKFTFDLKIAQKDKAGKCFYIGLKKVVMPVKTA